MELHVFLFEHLAGILKTTPDRGIVFSYAEEYLDSKKCPLSISLPLRLQEFSQKECLPYFVGLLPEGDVKRRIAHDLHVSELSTIKLLEALGGECAGSVSFYSEDFPRPQSLETKWELNETNYTRLSTQEISTWMKDIQTKPFIYAKNDARLSLAGAQEKITLAYFDDVWHLPKGNAPSTHILKPRRDGMLDTIPENEFICMKLAEKFNLPVPDTKLVFMQEIPIFVCARYDRILNKTENCIERLHQEDFCQALSIMNDSKYQPDGGPSYADCIKLIQNRFDNPIADSLLFIKSIVFNYLIGNCDCHGKNYSLVTDFYGKKYLSPLYDLVSTSVYESLTKKMAMKFGSNYDLEKIGRHDFIKLAENLNVKPRTLFDILAEFNEKMEKAFSEIEQIPELCNSGDIISSIKNGILHRFGQIEKP